MAKLRVLLTGATGYIAGQLLPDFRERYDLRLVDVGSHDRDGVPVEGVHVADLLDDSSDSDAAQVAALFEGVDVVVHCAYYRPPERRTAGNAAADPSDGASTSVPGSATGSAAGSTGAGRSVDGRQAPPGSGDQRYEAERRNVDLMQRVYRLCVEHGVPRVVAASTNQAAKWYERPYFQGLRDRVDPEDYPRPDSFYGWAKAAYESLGFLYACGSLGTALEVVQLRIVVPREIDGAAFTDQPRERYIRELAGYLSERDMRQLFRKSIETPDIADEHGVPFHIFYGVSGNARTFWSIANARKVIGYEPQDDSEIRFSADIARLLYPDAPG